MSASKQQALQILFSGEFDPAAMDLDMSELDTMEA
jgi:CheY-like chemotaxis protein